MPLDDLVSAIETLQKRIRDHGATLQQNETRTRMALIDPLLTALAWDVSDPAAVTPEYNVGNGRADYALNGSEAIPAAIVEAKRLGHNLSDDERMQPDAELRERQRVVRYAVITDGNVWELYEVFKQAPLEDRRSVGFAHQPTHRPTNWRCNCCCSGGPISLPGSRQPQVNRCSTGQTFLSRRRPLRRKRRQSLKHHRRFPLNRLRLNRAGYRYPILTLQVAASRRSRSASQAAGNAKSSVGTIFWLR